MQNIALRSLVSFGDQNIRIPVLPDSWSIYSSIRPFFCPSQALAIQPPRVACHSKLKGALLTTFDRSISYSQHIHPVRPLLVHTVKMQLLFAFAVAGSLLHHRHTAKICSSKEPVVVNDSNLRAPPIDPILRNALIIRDVDAGTDKRRQRRTEDLRCSCPKKSTN